MPALLITGSCAKFHWPELLDMLEERIYIAKEEVADLRQDNSRRYQAVQGYSIVAQEFSLERIDLCIKYALIPVCGVQHYLYRYEFDKSRGHIHFHMFAICGDKQPRMLLHELRRGGAQEAADSLATWALGR